MIEKDRITQIAIKLIDKHGLINLSKKILCDAAGIAEGSFKYIMGCTFTQFVDQLSESYDLKIVQVNKTKVNPRLRKKQIINIAIDIAREKGLNNLSRSELSNRAKCSPALIHSHFGTMNQLKRQIMRAAIQQEIIEIIAEGLGNNDPQACKAPAELKGKAIDLIANR